nr:MAG TPA: hypothetical protein [Caudoviricetes sp.]
MCGALRRGKAGEVGRGRQVMVWMGWIGVFRRDAFGCSLVCSGWHGAKNSERSKK